MDTIFFSKTNPVTNEERIIRKCCENEFIYSINGDIVESPSEQYSFFSKVVVFKKMLNLNVIINVRLAFLIKVNLSDLILLSFLNLVISNYNVILFMAKSIKQYNHFLINKTY